MKSLHVKGYYKDKFVLLSGPIDSSINVANPIRLENIYINIPVSLEEGKDIFEGDN